MAVVECTKRNSGDDVERRKGDDQPFTDRQTEEWDIVVDAPGYSSSRILIEAALPATYSPHPDNPNLRCTGEHQVRRVDGSPIHFMAVVTYESVPPGSPLPDPEQIDDDSKKPETREREPYEETWDSVEVQEPIDVDVNGAAICTVVGEQFDPPLTETYYDTEVTFSKNVEQRNERLHRMLGRVNSDVFLGKQAGQCLLRRVSSRRYRDPKSNKDYWRQSCSILIREEVAVDTPVIHTWDMRVRAEGYKVYNAQRKPVAARETRELSDAATPGIDGTESSVPRLHRWNRFNPDDQENGRQIDDIKKADWYIFETKRLVEFNTLNIT